MAVLRFYLHRRSARRSTARTATAWQTQTEGSAPPTHSYTLTLLAATGFRSLLAGSE